MQTTYVVYNSDFQRRGLDLNKVYGRRVNEFPNNLYTGEIFPLSQYVVESGPRDSKTNYLYGLERMDHPDQFSRFGYAWCPNGYCSGAWPGRYNEAPGCDNYNEQPANMAPSRFYQGTYVSPYGAESYSSVLGRIARNESGL
jgi:hypothetical protein